MENEETKTVPMLYRCMNTRYAITEDGRVYDKDRELPVHEDMMGRICVSIITPAGYIKDADIEELIHKNFTRRPTVAELNRSPGTSVGNRGRNLSGRNPGLLSPTKFGSRSSAW